jgi:hypothetical protein
LLGLGLKQERRKKKKKLTHGKRPEQKKGKKYYNTIRIATHATTFTIPLPTRRSSSHPPRLLFRTAAAATNKISGAEGEEPRERDSGKVMRNYPKRNLQVHSNVLIWV